RLDECHVRVTFDEPQSAVTPGQATVFYEGGVVLGGAWITAAVEPPAGAPAVPRRGAAECADVSHAVTDDPCDGRAASVGARGFQDAT
ncbi:MAG: hypothetical protein HY873_09775, partial [Chloroflexi bacterium]|nr:hypothetical protein [Chloroflexota bacterium]